MSYGISISCMHVSTQFTVISSSKTPWSIPIRSSPIVSSCTLTCSDLFFSRAAASCLAPHLYIWQSRIEFRYQVDLGELAVFFFFFGYRTDRSIFYQTANFNFVSAVTTEMRYAGHCSCARTRRQNNDQGRGTMKLQTPVHLNYYTSKPTIFSTTTQQQIIFHELSRQLHYSFCLIWAYEYRSLTQTQ